ncbi:MAG TPA: ATP-binding protein [Gaiellaceae bacterium]|nr:ATP-binding protein [Gaiellaceae bacterium]
MRSDENWSTYQLTEFLGAVATLRRADDVAGSAMQRIAEAVDAEIGAFVGKSGIVSSIGFPFGDAPEQTIAEAIEAGSGWLTLPDVGRGRSLVVPIEDEEFTSLLLARLGDDPFTRDEVNLVQGMVRVLELVLQNLRAFETERAMRASLQERQALLEKLARIELSMSHGAPLAEVLDAITEGATELFADSMVGLRLLDPEDPDHLLLVSSRGIDPGRDLGALRRTSTRSTLGGRAFLEERLVIVDDYQNSDLALDELRADCVQVAMSAPVREGGKAVGSLTVATRRPGGVYSSSEQEMLQALAEHASLALTDARMIEAMRTAEREKDAMLADLLDGIEQREQLEGQLRQSQKMDAVGQLAGGIAHDFNNLLMVILGYSQLVAESLGRDDPLVESVDEISEAAERAAALTRQLLAFSRQEVVQPQTIDLNLAVPNLLKLLRRMLRESIEFELELTPGVWSTNIDRSQFEQVIVNLAVNAGDAMSGGGTLRVSTENRSVGEDDACVAAGDYAVLTVTDTGDGMAADIAARAFEPFYTTKPRGSGTGLGLATVYGIVKQAGGAIDLQSALGCGTTATVYFPAATETIEQTPETPSSSGPAPRGGTVLVVEDEGSVRTLVQRILERNGYRVLVAESGAKALETVAVHDGEIAVVLTDVVMPGMSGRELADQVTAVSPELKVVFMSGYPDEVAADLGVLGPEANYLQKPFTAAGVLAAVERASGTHHAAVATV